MRKKYLIKTKVNSAQLGYLKVDTLEAGNIIDNSNRAMIALFAVSTKNGWLTCDGRTISYASDSSPGYIQTIYEDLILDLKTEAGSNPSHPYYHADGDKCKLPNKTNIAQSHLIGEPFYHTDSVTPVGCLPFGDTEYLISAYPDLYAVIGDMFATTGGRSTPAGGSFRVPPKGYFWRTLDNDGVYDPNGASRNAGDSQEDAGQGHRHEPLPGDNPSFAVRVASGGGETINTGTLLTNNSTTGDPVTDETNGTPRTDSETRSKNISFYGYVRAEAVDADGQYFLIKY